MLIAVDTRKTVPFSLPEDTTEPRTVFHLGYFDALLRAHLEQKHLTGEKQDQAGFMLDAVRYGLRGWENVADGEGKPVVCDARETMVPGVGLRPCVTDETLNHLRLEWIVALGVEIVKRNFLAADAAKN